MCAEILHLGPRGKIKSDDYVHGGGIPSYNHVMVIFLRRKRKHLTGYVHFPQRIFGTLESLFFLPDFYRVRGRVEFQTECFHGPLALENPHLNDGAEKHLYIQVAGASW